MFVTDDAETEKVNAFFPSIVFPVALFPVPVFPSRTNLISLSVSLSGLETKEGKKRSLKDRGVQGLQIPPLLKTQLYPYFEVVH